MTKPIKIGNYNISYLGSDFQEWFEGVLPEKGVALESKELPRSMKDKEIMAELKPEPVTLGDMLATLEEMDHAIWAIFYIKDKNGVLRTVLVRWFVDGWLVHARSVESPDGWLDGHRVFSRNFGAPSPSAETLTPKSLECPHCHKPVSIALLPPNSEK